jgi:uncharacterized protein (TIGR00290 family)
LPDTWCEETARIKVTEKILFAWSGGKDSALALYKVLSGQRYEVTALLTTVTAGYDRISMHGVRQVLLEQQANSLGFPLEKVWIPQGGSNAEYESRMRQVLEKHLGNGVRAVAFGDIFLEDIREYRERNLAKVGMAGVFPLWGRDTHRLIRSFLDLHFKAVVTCVDSIALGKEFVGRDIDEGFLMELPDGVDVCGENGEYHSFVYEGPILRERIEYTRGEIVSRDGRFFYCDLNPR